MGLAQSPGTQFLSELLLRERKQFYMSSKMTSTMSLLKVKKTRPVR